MHMISVCVCVCVVYVCVITSYFASSPLRRPMFCAVSVIWGSRLEGSPICGFCSYTPFIFSSASLRSDERIKGSLFWKYQNSLRKFLSTATQLIRFGGMTRSFFKLEDLLKGHAILLYDISEVRHKWRAKKLHSQLKHITRGLDGVKVKNLCRPFKFLHVKLGQ